MILPLSGRIRPKGRLGFIVHSLLRMISLLLAVTLITFTLISYSPFDPVTAYVGADATVSEAQKENIAEHWGFNDPGPVRYLKWMGNLLQGEMGTSVIFHKPVSEVLAERFSASMMLMGTAWVLSGVLGFTLGVVSGFYRQRWPDRLINAIALALASAPIFWLALLALMIFSVSLQWFPMGMAVPAGKLASEVTWGDRLYHLVLPALVLSVGGIANITLHTREKMISALNSDYMLFAWARGESRWRSVMRHGLRNIALPAITLQFASFSELFGGSILAEQVFSYPGLGSAATLAGLKGDIPLLLGVTLFSALFVFTGNLLANVIYGLVDPRISQGRRDVTH